MSRSTVIHISGSQEKRAIFPCKQKHDVLLQQNGCKTADWEIHFSVLLAFSQ